MGSMPCKVLWVLSTFSNYLSIFFFFWMETQAPISSCHLFFLTSTCSFCISCCNILFANLTFYSYKYSSWKSLASHIILLSFKSEKKKNQRLRFRFGNIFFIVLYFCQKSQIKSREYIHFRLGIWISMTYEICVYLSFLFDCLENLCVALGYRFLNWQDDKSIEYCSELNLKIKFC